MTLTASAPPPSWDPGPAARARTDRLIQVYRKSVAAHLEPLVRAYNPSMLEGAQTEYRKMLELSAKMNLVGHACTEIFGHAYDARRLKIGTLFGACCFLADSFIDDFGEAAAREYLERIELLLTEGWFDLKTDRERLFFVILSRLFAERDLMHPTVRQAILKLYAAQKQDVDLRRARGGPLGRAELNLLKRCARNRSGHAILVLSAFLVPELALSRLGPMFAAGALIMYIDDHGDCFSDRNEGRLTFMNQLSRPERSLKVIFLSHVTRLAEGLPKSEGRDLLIAFLTRYYLTRLEKHRQQKRAGGSAWAVHE
ncbi:MAG TPA: hypothetical protein VMU01_03265 [Rhizomicrobium sp.]|nr:hypothetical protein [Rhizomicrobium sp.]